MRPIELSNLLNAKKTPEVVEGTYSTAKFYAEYEGQGIICVGFSDNRDHAIYRRIMEWAEGVLIAAGYVPKRYDVSHTDYFWLHIPE